MFATKSTEKGKKRGFGGERDGGLVHGCFPHGLGLVGLVGLLEMTSVLGSGWRAVAGAGFTGLSPIGMNMYVPMPADETIGLDDLEESDRARKPIFRMDANADSNVDFWTVIFIFGYSCWFWGGT